MHTFSPQSLLLIVSLLAYGAVAQADPACKTFTTPYTATYYGSYKGWRVDTVQSLQKHDKNRWELTLRANNFLGEIEEKSVFRLNRTGLIESERYEHHRKVVLKNIRQNTVFDWKNKQAVTSGDKTGSVNLSGGELDNLNYQLLLRCDLMSGKSEFIYPVVDRKEIDRLEFKIMGEEVLETKLGKLDTIIVKRIRNNNNRITTLWFAKNMDYVMVKLLQEERKDTEAYLLYIDTLKK